MSTILEGAELRHRSDCDSGMPTVSSRGAQEALSPAAGEPEPTRAIERVSAGTAAVDAPKRTAALNKSKQLAYTPPVPNVKFAAAAECRAAVT